MKQSVLMLAAMNEIGLDPGIGTVHVALAMSLELMRMADHLYAVKMIDDVKEEGGSVTSFLSYCGGLT